MAINQSGYEMLQLFCSQQKTTLVAVSKTKPAKDIMELYQLGHRDFGENYVQELLDKFNELPKDIHWHFIGHLQSNKVKHIAPFVNLIHGVDTLSLLKEIDKQAKKVNRVIDCLLQVHIAREETKFGLSENELEAIMMEVSQGNFPNVNIRGLMGMASFSDDPVLLENEFSFLKTLFDKYKDSQTGFNILSMGMSADYTIAVKAGSNMIRVGSLLFGERKKSL